MGWPPKWILCNYQIVVAISIFNPLELLSGRCGRVIDYKALNP